MEIIKIIVLSLWLSSSAFCSNLHCRSLTTMLAFVDPSGREIIERYLSQKDLDRLRGLYIRFHYVRKQLELDKPTDPDESRESLQMEATLLEPLIKSFVPLVSNIRYRGDTYLVERFKNIDSKTLERDLGRLRAGKTPRTLPVQAHQDLKDPSYLYELQIDASKTATALDVYEKSIEQINQ